MTSIGARIGAIGRPPRIMGLDIARGLAVIGMIAAHMAGAPEINWGDPSTWSGMVHGRASILFALLAGVSTALVTGRTKRPDYGELPAFRSLLVRRGLTIFLFGLALELLNTNIAVILSVYGVLFLCAIPFLRWRVRSLVIGALALAVAGPFLLATLNVLLLNPMGPGIDLALFGLYPVPVWLALILAGMAIGRTDFSAARVAAGMLLMGIGLAVIGYVAGSLVMAQLDGAAGSASYGAAGPANDTAQGPAANPKANPSGGSGGDVVTVPGSQVGTLDLGGMECISQPGQWVNCYPPTPTEAAPEPQDESYATRLAATDPVRTGLIAALGVSEHSAGVFEIFGSGGFALAVLGLCLLLARPLRWLLLPIACLGMMPLTTYSAQVVIYWLLAGGPYGSFEPSAARWAWSTLALLAAATVWTVAVGRGPLERVVAAWAKPRTRARETPTAPETPKTQEV